MRLVPLFTAVLLFACSNPEPSAPTPDGGPGADAGMDAGNDPQPGTHGRRVVGYYPEWAVYARDFHVNEIPGQLLTHINYAFLNIDAAGTCVLGDAFADTQKVYPGDSADAGALHGSFNQLLLLKQRFPHLKTLLAIGGFTWSTRFSDVALTAESRARFARSCADVMQRYGFDGLDVDWEYPGGGGEALGRPEDTANFTLLLAAMRAELNSRGNFLLTIAAPAAPARIAAIEVSKIHPYVDWINLMAYDFHGAWEKVTGFNAPLGSAPQDPNPANANFHIASSAKLWIDGGTPRSKLVMGLPFYGRSWAGVGATANGLFQPASGAGPGTWEMGVVDWSDIKANYLPRLSRHFSEEAKVPWLYDLSKGVMISYDDPQSLTAKVNHVRGETLGGVMLWDLSGDDAESTLLKTVVQELNR